MNPQLITVQLKRRNCIELVAKLAQKQIGVPVDELRPQLRAELESQSACKDIAKTIDDATLDAVSFAIRTPLARIDSPSAASKLTAEKAGKKTLPQLDVEPSIDFIDDYVRYADYLEVPREAHKIAALTLIAAVANGNVRVMNGSMAIPLDFWTVILKQSGEGGNSLLRPFYDVLETSGLDDVISNVAFGSTSQAMEHFAGRPRDLLVMPEMSSRLDDWKNHHFSGLIPFVTNLYDETRRPDDKKYRAAAEDDNGNSKKTPDIEFADAPRTCIFGISASTWFFKSIQTSDFKGGFWPRFVMEWIEDDGKLIPTPLSSAQEGDVLRLARRLQQIAELKGEMRLTPAGQDRYESWYRETATRFRGFNNQPVAQPIWKRRRNHVFKLAAIYQLSVDPKLEIGLTALERAIEHCNRLEKVTLKILDLQLTHLGEERSEVEEFILRGKDEGVRERDVFRNLRGKGAAEKQEILNSLLAEERVFRFNHKTETRPGIRYVHEKSLSAYQKKYSESRMEPGPIIRR